ncbi:hypothetical protein [Aquimarina sediminis]|uniref:hypothetical protein n=1 Tax=Aquimarina sediminis TaxID=2070536 RepID=UPI000FFE78C8|nr:hypothetical protein [Aquimarina sediminis]
MSVEKLVYQLFYITGILTLMTSVFADRLIVVFKPLVVVALCVIYLIKTKQKNYLVIVTMLLIMVIEVLTAKDFVKYFRVLNILLSVYYILNIVLLWKSFKRIKVRLKKIFTIQLLITMVLIVYVLFSVADLILPQVHDDGVYLFILIVCFTVFIGVCYYIYLNSKTVVSSSLMVAASCFLIVNIITALNSLYVFLEVFVLIANFLQISGQYFLIKFFIEQQSLTPVNDDYL